MKNKIFLLILILLSCFFAGCQIQKSSDFAGSSSPEPVKQEVITQLNNNEITVNIAGPENEIIEVEVQPKSN